MMYNDSVSNLCNAVIIQAVKDYRKALAEVSPLTIEKDGMVISLEHFFRSDWFTMLTAVDGELIIEKIRKEFGYEYKRKK